MRIRVTTSINVRSNTVPSTPALVHDALPEDWNNYIVPEKENPTLAMPSLESAQSRLLASQRIPKGSRLSAWLHGFSVVGNQQRPTVAHHRKVSHTTTQCYSRTPRRSRTQTRPTGLRPANSTRGVIDPVHSPTTSCWPLSNQSFDDRRGRDGQPPTFEPYTPWTPATASSPHLKSGTHRRKKNLKSSNKKPQHSCFPHVNDPKLRHKIFGCLFFGTLLTLVLTTCTSIPSSPIPPTKTDCRYRPRPRNLRYPRRPHLPRCLHLRHPHPHNNIQPLPNPPLHALPPPSKALRIIEPK